jgi:hypothetical protein
MCFVEEGFSRGAGGATEAPFLLKGFDEGKSEAILLTTTTDATAR